MNKKYILLILLIGIVAILIGVFAFIFEGKTKVLSNDKVYENIIKAIDKKESFNVLITDDDETNQIFEYYANAYLLSFKQLKKDPSNSTYNKLIDKLSFDINKTDKGVFVIVKEGIPTAALIGDISEKNLKQLLIENRLIDKKYNEIDNLVEYDFKNYYNNHSGYYTILLIDSEDKNKNEYRKALVDNDIKSVVIYTGTGDLYEIKELNNIIGDDEKAYQKTPMVININNKKILKYYDKVKVEELIEKTKK